MSGDAVPCGWCRVPYPPVEGPHECPNCRHPMLGVTMGHDLTFGEMAGAMVRASEAGVEGAAFLPFVLVVVRPQDGEPWVGLGMLGEDGRVKSGMVRVWPGVERPTGPRVDVGASHWPGCWREHHGCAVAEVERLGADLARAVFAVADAPESLEAAIRPERARFFGSCPRCRGLNEVQPAEQGLTEATCADCDEPMVFERDELHTTDLAGPLRLSQHLQPPAAPAVGTSGPPLARAGLRTPAGYRRDTSAEVFVGSEQVVITGQPPTDDVEGDDARHECDVMGCATLSHVIARIPIAEWAGELVGALPNEPDGGTP